MDNYPILFGKAVTEFPSDLFIPPNALTVILQQFEGPLDLLLYLIRKQNLDILDIPIVCITEQYLDYIHQMNVHQMDLAAEYLLMASVLIEIKSRFLLPKPENTEENDIDPRAELARRLLIYEQIKKAAEYIHKMPQEGRDFFHTRLPQEVTLIKRLPVVSPADLQSAWMQILSRQKQFKNHKIEQEFLSIRDQMIFILHQLQKNHRILFKDLFEENKSLSYYTVNFIAVLELAKESIIEIIQNEPFGPILILQND